jgi:glycosyltransferase involved in cell wall biosynthesis
MCLNSFFFQRDIRRIIRREEIDLMITADSGHMTGLPPFDVEIPVIFDYLDGGTWDSPNPSVRPYITNSDAVLSVSKQATEQASQLNQNVTYLPNGADITRLRSASGNAVRKKYGLLDATVVSLIGLGASGSHYFIDAVRKARREIPELQCLLVGDSESVVQSLDRLPDSTRETFVYTGPVPYDEIASFFAASDVGIYPVDATPYDDGRCPIKIFEYTARGTPVVVPRLREVERLDFNNIVYASPEASSFAEGIVEASKRGPTQDSKVEKYDWAQIADRLDEKLRSVSQQV